MNTDARRPRGGEPTELPTVRPLAALLLLVTVAACEAAAPAQALPSDAPSGMSSATPSPSAGRDEQERLALAEVDGDGAVEAALRRVQERLRATPDNPDLWIELGRAWIQKARGAADPGFYLHAAAAADIALRKAPGDRAALNLRGLVLLNQHSFAEARDLARQILAGDADDPQALGTLSDALLELGDIEGAEAAAQQMMDRKPNLPSYSRAAHFRWLRGDVKGATESLRLAFDAGRGQRDTEPSAWVLVEAATVFWHEGDLDGALAGAETALSLRPGYPQALALEARVLLARGDAAGAADLLATVDNKTPTADIAWRLGDARLAAGDRAGADAAYEQVRVRGRRDDRRTLALFLATRGEQLDEALRLVTDEQKLRGGLYTDDVHAWVLHRLGRHADARLASDRALALGTRDALLWYHAGAIALAAGDQARGRELLQKALELNPHFDPTAARDARALLER